MCHQMTSKEFHAVHEPSKVRQRIMNWKDWGLLRPRKRCEDGETEELFYEGEEVQGGCRK